MKGPNGKNRPVGLTRRVTGFILVALGAFLVNQMGWMVVFGSPWFGPDEWVRFVGLLWLGLILAMLGYWLAYRSRAAAYAVGGLAGLVAVIFVVIYVHDHWLR
jgi:hypothetical protein